MNHFSLQEMGIEKNLSRTKYRIGIWSGKGGVGKTTLAVNIAAILAERNSVGILDADIDCPNVCEMLSIDEKADMTGTSFKPPEKFGMKVISTSLLHGREEPIILRGPMKHKVLVKLIELSDFGALDYLIIDMPPGTSDIPLSAMQFLRLSGLIIISTPQRASIHDMKKSIMMARSLGTRILGTIENMSSDMFGSGTVEAASQQMGVNYLGQITMRKSITDLSNRGVPPVLHDEEFRNEMWKVINNIKLH